MNWLGAKIIEGVIMRNSRKGLLVGLFVISVLLGGCSNIRKSENIGSLDKTNNQKSTKILVAAAASLRDAMEELQKMYKDKYPEVDITFAFGGSGSLQQQIEQGAPADIFISAAQKQMNVLIDEKLIIEKTKIDLLENKVVLIIPKDSKLDIVSFEDILKASIIALGDPASVPVGQYAEEIFNKLNILDDVNAKATFAKDVTEVLTWVSTGNVDAGVVYATDAALNDKVIIAARAPKDSYSKAIYQAAVVKNTKEEELAADFVHFLSSEEAKIIFKRYGFLPIE